MSSSTRIPWWPFWVLMACCFWVFWPTLSWTAFSDDHSALWNTAILGSPWRNGIHRPLSDLTLQVGGMIWGGSVFGHRLVNLLIHGLNAYLLFRLTCRILATHGPTLDQRAAWFASLLFLTYPFHQESMVWLVGRESALGTTFVLFGCLVALSYFKPWVKVLLACLALVLGALCYGTTFLLPLIVVPLLWRSEQSRSLRLLALWLLGTAAVLVIAQASITTWDESSYFSDMLNKGFSGTLLNIPKVIARLFLPPTADSSAMLMRSIVLLLVLASALFVILRRSSDRVLDRVVIIRFAALLLITLIVPVLASVSTQTSESDRFLYLPSAFLCLMLGWLLSTIRRPPIRWASFGLLLVASVHFLRMNHANWQRASELTAHILGTVPQIKEDQRIFVTGLPDSVEGAFVFRNGFPEAVAMLGKGEGTWVVVLDDAGSPRVPVHWRGQVLSFDDDDRWFHWSGLQFEEQHVVSATEP